MVCNVFIFREISELLWEGSTKGIVLMYSLIISWHLLDGDAVWGDASFPVFQKAMDCSFEFIDPFRDSLQPPAPDIQRLFFPVYALFCKPRGEEQRVLWD